MKNRKILAILLVIAMACMLCVSAFAEGPANSSNDLEKSVITKVFKVPAGVDAPAARFDFLITPTSQPSSMSLTAKTESIVFPAGTGTQTRVISLSDFIGYNDTTKDFNITQPGEYVFNVKETAGTAAGVATAPETGTYYLQDNLAITSENVAFDTKEYTLRLYVINGENGLETKAITVVDASKTDDVNGSKVNPEDTDPTNDPEAEEPDDNDDATTKVGSDFKFTNVYTKVIEDTEANGGAFNLEKDVTGSGDTGAKFPFTVKITIDEETLNNGAYSLTAGGKTWSFTSAKLNDSQEITLADAEKLVFTVFPAGATVKITENLQSSSIQNKALYTGSATGLATGSYTKGEDLSVTTDPINAKGQVKVTNNLDDDDITPTGILMNNLPYIILLILAGGGLTAYIVSKRREQE